MTLSRILPLAALLAAPTVALAESTEVLWYNGNNGYTSSDPDTLQSTIEGLGGTFTSTDTFPDSLTSYRIVFLVSPARLFSPTHLALLQEYVASDGMLVLLGNEGGEAGSLGVLMSLTDDLGLSSTFVAEEHDDACSTRAPDGNTATKDDDTTLTECVETLTYGGSAELMMGTGTDSLFIGESDQILVGVEGNVMLVADRDIFLDTCTISGDNVAFFQQIYAGDATGSTDEDCDGYGPSLEGGEDCDDADETINPDAEDTCDGVDNNCDGVADNDPTYGSTWYLDADNDGYGILGATTVACEDPEGYADNTSDCDDTDYSKNPGADEVCNDEDDNCDGTSDNDPVDGTTWYADVDEDGYGSELDWVAACDQPSGYIATGGDCDDTLSRVQPGADEYCNDADDDCDDEIDEDAANATSWYTDADGDFYGDPNSVVESCDAPAGTVADGRDCDDPDAAIYPGAEGWTVTCEQLGAEGGGTEDKGEGCGCSAGSSPSGWWLLAPLGLLLGRRRRA